MPLKALDCRKSLLHSASLAAVAICLPLPAFAQAPVLPTNQPPAAEAPAALDRAGPEASRADAAASDIVVTGSRIATRGFTAPTPTTVIGAQDIAQNAQPNIFNTIAQLPSLQGSTGTQVNTFSTSSGQQGLSSFSLRGLGAIRTLTLLDGQRVVGANVTGVPDVSLFPQLLVQRVDVVNGGASASYGSDAVGGVVNFITDTRFTGIKGNVQGGITTYGDNKQILAQLAIGHAFGDGRLHFVASGEYAHDQGVDGGDYGLKMAGGRTWFDQTSMIDRGILNDGSPQFIIRNNVQSNSFTKYGLITGGPLQGTAFDASGQPFQFQYGSNGTPTRKPTGGVNGCFGGLCLGGDLSGNIDVGRSLQSALQRVGGYTRVGFDIAPDNELYFTVNVGQVKTNNQPVNGMNKPGLTLQCANPYVPASIQAACATAGISSFQYGTSNAELGNTRVYTNRRQYRFVGGAKGKVPLLGSEWSYDIYGEHGTNYTSVDVNNILLTPRFNAAIDAVLLNGAIVCRSAVARANGCQPLNIIGNNPSAEALSYVTPDAGPYQRTRQTQDVLSLNFSGAPVNLWAGPLSIAFGGEFRHEFYKVRADPYGAGFANSGPSSDYPLDPILNASGNGNWYAGTYKNGRGAYSVKEGFFEANLPILDSEALGKANVNAAARYTDYSTSGGVWAWKVGGTWALPIDGFHIRAVTSRDVRAPNLSELFAAPVTQTLPNFFDPYTRTNVLVVQNQIGNTALKPEIARNTTAGITLSNPKWLPGLNLSFDYYKIKINGVISGLGANDIVNFCFQNILTSTCNSFNLNPANGQTFINVQSFNLASIDTDGFDIEASYRWARPLGLSGNFTVRALATHVMKFVTDTGLPGTIPVDSAGDNTSNTPDWKWLAIQSYDTDKFSFLLQERWFSDGTFGNKYIVCAPGSCPVSNNNHPTIDQNFYPGRFYMDVGGSYNIRKDLTAYFKIDNMFDVDPASSTIFNNPSLYDQLGRTFRLGVRFKM
ncbi:TonB-dependent receptor plug domain-containing protein [Sphingomonas sp. BAUL-RG-20F-R05-02]|uniref:TonB-dependent receptor plug domain-containing protein n=1 Tax=Sphingomonas sp. BAUL-RG-20F-R05-02 TaxID=2914830 RepID=UPI001F56B96D|nr:TonB-dependent receptor [Sphingomonas sp. BAUL-RG-20F-R05-02]